MGRSAIPVPGPPETPSPDLSRTGIRTGIRTDTSVWQGGFTADVTMANTGSSPVNGWNLAFTLPSGQQITNAWNAGVSPSSGAVTAANAAHDANIAQDGQVSFGFQASYGGGFVKPGAFSLNGTACTTA